MSQPIWKCVGNIGGVSPEHGACYVFEDTTGAYPAEAEYIMPHTLDGDEYRYQVYRFILDRCTFIGGILSDNKYHPEHPAWFAKPESERANRPQDTTYLRNVADSCGFTVENLVNMFIDEKPCARAYAYLAVGDYHGYDNLDAYPLDLSEDELYIRYAGIEIGHNWPIRPPLGNKGDDRGM